MKKIGDLIISNKDDLKETALYKGAENPLIYSREFNVQLKCTFHLVYFPFDTHTCSITLKAGNKVRNFIELVGEAVDFTGNAELATFSVVGWELETDEESSNIDVKVNIILKRQISPHLLGIYLPSIFITIIAQVRNID